MKNQKFGFTLIELLVVIVIIGILATISTATFSGYFTKARDSERQTFVRNAQQIILAHQVTEDTVDYDLGGADEAGVATNVGTALSNQGYSVPDAKNDINYYYLIDGTIASTASANFMFFVCKEDALPSSGDTNASTTLADIAYTAGTSTAGLTGALASAVCDATPADPGSEVGVLDDVVSGWTCIDLNDGAACTSA